MWNVKLNHVIYCQCAKRSQNIALWNSVSSSDAGTASESPSSQRHHLILSFSATQNAQFHFFKCELNSAQESKKETKDWKGPFLLQESDPTLTPSPNSQMLGFCFVCILLWRKTLLQQNYIFKKLFFFFLQCTVPLE